MVRAKNVDCFDCYS